MKKIEAIIKPFRLDDVKDRIYAAGGTGLTVSEVRGLGRTGGRSETYRASQPVDFVPKVRLQLFVEDDGVQRIVDAILASARTGGIGDGKITISALDDVVRIRTGEHGPDAL